MAMLILCVQSDCHCIYVLVVVAPHSLVLLGDPAGCGCSGPEGSSGITVPQLGGAK